MYHLIKHCIIPPWVPLCHGNVDMYLWSGRNRQPTANALDRSGDWGVGSQVYRLTVPIRPRVCWPFDQEPHRLTIHCYWRQFLPMAWKNRAFSAKRLNRQFFQRFFEKIVIAKKSRFFRKNHDPYSKSRGGWKQQLFYMRFSCFCFSFLQWKVC